MKFWNAVKAIAHKVNNFIANLFNKSVAQDELAVIDEKISNFSESHQSILNKIADKQHMIEQGKDHAHEKYITKTCDRLLTSYAEREAAISKDLNFLQYKRQSLIQSQIEKHQSNPAQYIHTITFEL